MFRKKSINKAIRWKARGLHDARNTILSVVELVINNQYQGKKTIDQRLKFSLHKKQAKLNKIDFAAYLEGISEACSTYKGQKGADPERVNEILVEANSFLTQYKKDFDSQANEGVDVEFEPEIEFKEAVEADLFDSEPLEAMVFQYQSIEDELNQASEGDHFAFDPMQAEPTGDIADNLVLEPADISGVTAFIALAPRFTNSSSAILAHLNDEPKSPKSNKRPVPPTAEDEKLEEPPQKKMRLKKNIKPSSSSVFSPKSQAPVVIKNPEKKRQSKKHV